MLTRNKRHLSDMCHSRYSIPSPFYLKKLEYMKVYNNYYFYFYRLSIATCWLLKKWSMYLIRIIENGKYRWKTMKIRIKKDNNCYI